MKIVGLSIVLLNVFPFSFVALVNVKNVDWIGIGDDLKDARHATHHGLDIILWVPVGTGLSLAIEEYEAVPTQFQLIASRDRRGKNHISLWSQVND